MQGEQFVLNPLDLIIAGVIVFGMVRGAKKGVVTRANSLLTIGLSILLGFRLRRIAESLFLDYLNLQLSGEMAAILGFCTAFVIVYLVISTLLGYLTTGLKRINIKIDNALGALFGGLVATMVLSVGLIILSYVNFPSNSNAQGSILYPHVRDFSKYAVGMGAEALKEANRQINKYGLGGPPTGTNPRPPEPPPPDKRPDVIR
ncbi:MAG: CvpA family protein [Bacteroidota bacterium]